MVTFRPTAPEDLLTISGWLAQKKKRAIDASFYTCREQGVSCYVISDEQGPVIFVRQEVEGEDTRLHTEFPAEFIPGSRKRVAAALNEAYPLVRADAAGRGFRRVRFASVSIALIRFMLRFGFRAEMVADL